jgi:predicted metallopeptidase
MSNVRYEVADGSVRQMLERVINSFPQRFIHVNPEHVHIVFKDSEKSKWKARVRLVKGLYQTLTNKPIAMEVWKADWLNSNEAQRAAVMYHELTHIAFDEEKGSYKLRHHDVEDFFDVVKEFGLSYESAEAFFKDKLK